MLSRRQIQRRSQRTARAVSRAGPCIHLCMSRHAPGIINIADLLKKVNLQQKIQYPQNMDTAACIFKNQLRTIHFLTKNMHEHFQALPIF